MISLRRHRMNVKPIAGVGDSLRVKPITPVESGGVAFADVLRDAMLAAKAVNDERANRQTVDGDSADGKAADDKAGQRGLSADENNSANTSGNETPGSGAVIMKGWSLNGDSGTDLHEQLDSLLNKKSVLIGVA